MTPMKKVPRKAVRAGSREPKSARANAYKYDVAFSFLSAHARTAQKLEAALQPLECFVYTTSQAETAGKNGPNALARFYKQDARIVAVLHSDGWGQSGYTELEQLAIQEFVFECGWDRLLLIKLDESDPPIWFPRRARFYADVPRFGIAEGVTAIRIRAAEEGAELRPETLIERERRRKRKRDADDARETLLNSPAGAPMGHRTKGELFAAVETLAREVGAENGIRVEAGSNGAEWCGVATPFASLLVRFYYQYSNSLLNSALYVEYYRGMVFPPKGREQPNKKRGASLTAEEEFHLAIGEDDLWGWRAKSGDIVSSSELANRMVGRVFDLFHEANELRREARRRNE